MVPVPEEQLPVLLPDNVQFKPGGESPLRYEADFVNTTCPICGGPCDARGRYHGYLHLFLVVLPALRRPAQR